MIFIAVKPPLGQPAIVSSEEITKRIRFYRRAVLHQQADSKKGQKKIEMGRDCRLRTPDDQAGGPTYKPSDLLEMATLLSETDFNILLLKF